MKNLYFKGSFLLLCLIKAPINAIISSKYVEENILEKAQAMYEYIQWLNKYDAKNGNILKL